MEAGLSLGSNLGNRLGNLREATRRLLALDGVRLLAAAPLYETEPIGTAPGVAQPLYLNTVLIVAAPDDPEALSRAVHAIEDALGRVRTSDRNAARTIDIDILYAGHTVRSDGILDLPHPRWSLRRFVVQPLADVRPDLVVPGTRQTVSAVLAALPPGEGVVRLADVWLP